MKKKISLLLAAVLVVSSVCATGAAAADTQARAETTTIGSNVAFPDAQPFVDDNDRTLIPVRFVAETMGAEVEWDQEAQAAIIEQDGTSIAVPIGSDTISVTQDGNTSAVRMDTAAIIREERTYVPIRYVAKALGAWVSYSDLFTTVQIYRDVLTPEEITRLHGYYDMTWNEHCEATETISTKTDEEWINSYPQVAYFTGTYGFENSNEWKLRNPNGIEVVEQPLRTPTDYVGVVSGLTYTYGTQPDIDFANLVLAEARGVEDELNADGKVKLSLRTDLSCVYWSRHSTSAGAYVRGVLTVTIPENADITWIQQNYDFISNPKAGESRDVDVEIRVNTFTANVHWSSMTAFN